MKLHHCTSSPLGAYQRGDSRTVVLTRTTNYRSKPTCGGPEGYAWAFLSLSAAIRQLFITVRAWPISVLQKRVLTRAHLMP